MSFTTNKEATGMLKDGSKEWRTNSTDTSTYDDFKIRFTEHDKYHTKKDTTASSAGYANQVKYILHGELTNFIDHYPHTT